MNSPTALAPKPFGPIPTTRQLRWHRHEYYGFLHFGINTFTGKEWGYGDEPPDVFAPASFNADQIAQTAVDAGMAGLILTCKHHDGFCLWPSRYTNHSVKYSAWKDGKGDVVREISDACARHKILFGTYLSPWDRNHAEYGRPAYLEYFQNQLQELTTEYGGLFEVWFDGANGGDGFYGGACETRKIDRRTYYDWKNTWQIVRRNQDGAVMFSDAGPDVRWVGNEQGFAGDPCWATLDSETLYPGFGGPEWETNVESDMVKAWGSAREMLNQGDPGGNGWLPAECDVSIRPGWFYHAEEDEQVRSVGNLFDLYCRSVGRGASMLLNLPPDRRGLIHENDVRSLKGFRERRDAIFTKNLAADAHASADNTRGGSLCFTPGLVLDGNPDSYWSTDDGITSAGLVLDFSGDIKFNMVSLREYLPLGQRVRRYAVDIDQNGVWSEYLSGSAIGSRRLLRGEPRTTRKIRLRVTEGTACPAISEIGIFLDA